MMLLRNSDRFIVFTTASCLLLAVFTAHARLNGSSEVSTVNRQLMQQLKLTDLCIFTEARYTRNPSLADNHAPFQEHPAAFEHFPSGSLLPPPAATAGHSP